MSSSSGTVDAGRIPGQKTARGPEKSSFSQMCSMLSQYLKENGNFGDLSLGMTSNFEANDVPENLGQKSSSNTPTMDLFPQQAGFYTSPSKDELPKRTDHSVKKSGPETKQMTIFYGGQVIVFNDLPADKAKEVLLLAGKSSQKPEAAAQKPPQKVTETTTSLIPPPGNVVPSFTNNSMQERAQQPRQPVASDLPIARNASLARFLEKRKDRIHARAPYPTLIKNNQPSSSSSSSHPIPVETKNWLGLVAQSAQQFQPQL